jgi:hypothetical protein
VDTVNEHLHAIGDSKYSSALATGFMMAKNAINTVAKRILD